MSRKIDRPRDAARPAGRKAVGHPVDVASGVFFLAWHDVEIGGGSPLVLRRYYSTSLTGDATARLGPGWTHNLALGLSELPTGYDFRDQNGSVIWFPRPERWDGSPIINAASSMELRVEGDLYCIHHWHDWRTAVEKLWFRRSPAGAFRLERISPPSGFGLVLDYDQRGRLRTVEQMIERRRITLVYDDRDLLTELAVGSPVSLDRRVASYAYDSQARLVEVRDALGVPIRYGYDAAGRIVSEASRSGAVFQIRYDAEGRCVETRGTDGHHRTRLQYAPARHATIVTNSLGAVTVYELNESGQVLKETRPNGAVLSIAYDDRGRIVEEVDALRGVVEYAYDASSNTASVAYPNGLRTEAEFDDDHQPLLVRQGDSAWRFTYARKQLVSVVDPSGIERRYRYSDRGYLSALSEPSGNVVTIEPDEAWTRVRFADDFGLDREEWYNDLMHLTQRVEPDGGVYRFEFDEVDRLVGAAVPGAPFKRYEYDASGSLASATDEDGHTVRLLHNRYGLLERVTTPTGRISSFTWNTEGSLASWVNPAGERAEFGYDAVGNQTTVRHFDGRVESSTFDVAGRVTQRELADGTILAFEYDGSNNLLRLHSGGVDLIASEYDVVGRVVRTRTPQTDVSFEYGSGFRIVAEVQNGRRVDYAYDATGALSERRFAGSPLPPLEFEWDRRLRLVAARRGGAVVQTLQYDAKDQCVERRFGSCVERLEYGPSGALIGQTVVRDMSVLVSRAWARDGRRNVVRIDDRLSGERRFRIDGDHRLVESAARGTATAYSYDLGGNLVASRGERDRDFEYLSGGRLAREGTTTYERDENGRVTSIIDGSDTTSLTWDALSQLVEVRLPSGSVVTYAYDGLGRRLRRVVDGAVTEYVWTGEQFVAEVSASVVTETLSTDFSPTTLWQGTKVFHLINSHLGVPQEALTDRGAVVWSQRLGDWGEVERVDGDVGAPVPFRFPGQYATDGLYYNRYRYYDPRACQYLSPDPLGLSAGAHEYMYAPNPVNWVDPFGLSCGIPPGTHSVYVLESGRRASPGPPPTPAIPPTPPRVIYVGITVQSPHDRLSQHKANPPGGVTPDGMRIIASGPPTVPDRTGARLIEASILTNHPAQPPGGGVPPGPGGLNNAPRPVNGGYYHSNVPSSAPPGTTHLPPSTTNPMLAPTNGTVIT